MNVVNRIAEFGKALWNQTSGGARVGLIAAIVACVLVIVGVGYWSSQPYYVPLTDSIGPVKAAKVKDKLDSVNISNKLSYAGNAVLVDQSDFSAATVAVADILDTDDLSESPSGWSMGGSQNSSQDTSLLEQRIARKLETLKPIKTATVSLAIPDSSPFLRERIEPSASVVVVMNSHVVLSKTMGRSIASVVASGVNGLKAGNVEVIDENGRFVRVGGDDSGLMIGDQNETRRAFENGLAKKALEQLETMLGAGMAKVSVTAEIDFDSSITTSTVLSDSKKAKISEKLQSEEAQEKISGRNGGPAGTASNLVTLSGNSKKGPKFKSETLETEWKPSEERTVLEVRAGKTKRLSVSVVAELPKPEVEEGTAPPVEDLAKRRSELEDLVKTAVGFDESRGDQFKLVITDLAGKELIEGLWEETSMVMPPFWLDIIKNASLAIAALVALVIGIMLIKRIQPITIQQPGENRSWSPERARQITDMSSMIRENPELLSRIVAAWSNNSDADGEASQSTSKKRKAA